MLCYTRFRDACIKDFYSKNSRQIFSMCKNFYLKNLRYYLKFILKLDILLAIKTAIATKQNVTHVKFTVQQDAVIHKLLTF